MIDENFVIGGFVSATELMFNFTHLHLEVHIVANFIKIPNVHFRICFVESCDVLETLKYFTLFEVY